MSVADLTLTLANFPVNVFHPLFFFCYSSWITKRGLFRTKVAHVLEYNLKKVSDDVGNFAIGTY
jgi:hypothetical protein